MGYIQLFETKYLKSFTTQISTNEKNGSHCSVCSSFLSKKSSDSYHVVKNKFTKKKKCSLNPNKNKPEEQSETLKNKEQITYKCALKDRKLHICSKWTNQDIHSEQMLKRTKNNYTKN